MLDYVVVRIYYLYYYYYLYSGRVQHFQFTVDLYHYVRKYVVVAFESGTLRGIMFFVVVCMSYLMYLCSLEK